MVTEGGAATHRCDAAGRTVISGAAEVEIGPGATVKGSTLINADVGARSSVVDTWARDLRLGPDSIVTSAKLVMTNTGPRVRITGPTEISEAWLGHDASIASRGYYEGIFSNAFRCVRFDATTGKLKVSRIIDLPHLSVYGVNTINSANSGKLLPQSDGVLRGFGPHKGLWSDPLLSHEQIELGPCCWVGPWTKIIGQSSKAHYTDEELVNDRLTTYVMPFAAVGVDGDATNGLVMPGELSTGYGPKKRRGAWVFTYAPDLVIRMVARLYEALVPGRKEIADSIVSEALETAIAMTRSLAYEHNVDLGLEPGAQRRGWPRWIAQTYLLLKVHLESRLWVFSQGSPVKWERKEGRWWHPELERILAIAPDAAEKQVNEEQIFAFDDRVQPVSVAVPSGWRGGSGGDARIDPGSTVHAGAFVGPGSVIGSGCKIEDGARIWNSVLSNSRIGKSACVERSVLAGTTVGEGTTVRSCGLTGTELGGRSTADAAAVCNSSFAGNTTVSALAEVENVHAAHPTILGGPFREANIEVVFMAMHMAGSCRHLRAMPTAVELGGQRTTIPAVPMIGGGAVIRGTADAPVEMECAFIGSNAVIGPGCMIGFGSFVLGELGRGTGLPPFTVSTGGAATSRIGGVLTEMPGLIITHFINWTFQALGPDAAPAIAVMTNQVIDAGIAGIEKELGRRAQGRQLAYDPRFPWSRGLSALSDSQLQAGLTIYRDVRKRGEWDISFDGRELVFSSDKGHWTERRGSAFWVTGRNVFNVKRPKK